MIEELADLRHRWMQAGPAYPGGMAALVEIRRHLDSLATRGEQRCFRQPDGALGAAVLWGADPLDPFYRASVTHLIAQHDGSPAGQSWLSAALAKLLRSLPDDIECVVPAADVATRGVLCQEGLGVSTVLLAGRVGQARQSLQLRARVRPESIGLCVEELCPADADEVIDLLRRVFTEEPEYAWFIVGEAWLERRRAQLAAGEQDQLSLLLRRGGRLLGIVEASVKAADAHHGSSVGVGLVLDREIRGCGLASYAYDRVLTLAEEGGAEWIKGATARPAVLHLATQMGRRPVSVFMRRRPVFGDGRFDGVLGEVLERRSLR